MNVLFDHQVFSFQEYGGISRYFAQLLMQFSARNDIHANAYVKYSNNAYLHSVSGFTPKPFFQSHRFKGRNEIIRLLNQFYCEKEYPKHSPPDIFHPTYYHQYFLDLIGTIPFVLTIYDMAHEIYPNSFHPFDFTIKNKKALTSKASRIIAISEHTKNDVVKLLGVPESVIDVIPLATDIRLDTSFIPQTVIPQEFILYVGARNTYKNFLFFLRSVASIIRQKKDLHIICAGGGAFSPKELKEIDVLGLNDKVVQMNVGDNLLASLYSRTKAFVYPSLYEGFGIPVLEAFTCGAPVILSNKSSLPEVGGDAAVYFDPENKDSLESVLWHVIDHKDTAHEMITKGSTRVKEFSWESTADKTIETYKKVLRHH